MLQTIRVSLACALLAALANAGAADARSSPAAASALPLATPESTTLVNSAITD